MRKISYLSLFVAALFLAVNVEVFDGIGHEMPDVSAFRVSINDDRKDLLKDILAGCEVDEFTANIEKAVEKKIEEEATIKECRKILADADVYDEDRSELYKTILDGISVESFSKKDMLFGQV